MSKPSQELSDAEISDLIESITLANVAGDETCGFAIQRLERCLESGEKLVAIKTRIPHGKWEGFCEKVLARLKDTKVTVRTLQNWMRLYRNRKEGRIDLGTVAGIRQAYQLAGIVPESEDSKTGKIGTEQEPLYMVHILRLNACLTKLDTKSLSSDESDTLQERLEPIHRFYLALA